MTFLTPEETAVLRLTLGLHATCRRGITRNFVPASYVPQYQAAIDSLVARGFMYVREKEFKATYQVIPAGSYAVTEAGRVAVLDEPWR